MAISSLQEMHNDFMVYAKAVNENRAFPDVIDGLKPSQRACLWEMYNQGYTSSKPHVKSAKVDGGTIANWSPHGSVYDTFVRMSQPWVNNIPEVDFHGANGSLQGGPEAAASRYTECRLAKASEDGFFTNIKKDTTDFILNYSEDKTWPKILPAIFPRLFVNGSQGIGYTIAQEWEPGNLNEFVEKVKQYLKGKLTYDNIYPDYPTGGVIINGDDIADIYKTGKGTVVLRGTTEIDNKTIKITSLPYQVYVEPFIAKVKELVNNETITGIDDICNKSDDNGILVEIECSDDPVFVLNNLYKLTDLQCTFSANQMALVNGVPEMITLNDYIKIYVENNLTLIEREYKFDLLNADRRGTIIQGLLKAIKNIDHVIALIRSSKSSADAEKALIAEGYQDVQAKAIVDMRLGKLANLEIDELEAEDKEINKVIANCMDMLRSDKKQKAEFLSRLEKFASKYGWARRTAIDNIDFKAEHREVKKTKVSNEQYMVALINNTIRKIKLSDYRSDKTIKAIKVGAKDKIILISENGMMYKMPVNKITRGTVKSSGDDLNAIYGETILNIFSGQETEPYLFFATDKGKVKKVSSEEVFKINKKIGTTVMKLNDEKMIYADLITEGSITINGHKINTDKFKVKGRKAGGVKGFKC